jgi:hypothetical protein
LDLLTLWRDIFQSTAAKHVCLIDRNDAQFLIVACAASICENVVLDRGKNINFNASLHDVNYDFHTN